MFFEQLDVLGMTQIRQSLRSRFEVQQTAFCSFLNPCIGITVAVKDDTLMSLVGFFNKIIYCCFQVRSICQLISKFIQLFGNDGVQYDVGACDGEHAAQHTEFKFIAGEGEGRGSVSVGVVFNKSRNGIVAYFNVAFRVAVVNLICCNSFENCSQLSAKEHGNDSRRSFICAQTMVIAGAGNRYTQQILIFINSLDNCCQEGQEAQVFVRLLAGIQQVQTFFRR